jgi:hypothetical protein
MRGGLIDKYGLISAGVPAPLHKFLGSMSISALTSFSILNLGYVEYGLMRSGAVVRLRPAIVSPAAYAALMTLLFDGAPSRVAVNYYDEGSWRHEIICDRISAMRRITSLVRNAMVVNSKSVVSERLVAGSVGNRYPFQSLVTDWAPVMEPQRLNELLEKAEASIDGRYVVFELDVDRQSFVFRRVGAGMPIWARHCHEFQNGRPLIDFPDYAFGAACTTSYIDACRTMQPVVEAIDAMIDWPSHGKLHRRYGRLLLPIEDRTGRVILLSASVDDPTIDLRGRRAANE